MMTIDFTTVLTDAFGKEIDDDVIPTRAGDTPQKLTLGRAVLHCLNAIYPKHDQDITGDEKFKRIELALRVNKAAAAELVAEEIAMIKDLSGKFYSPIIVHRIWTMLDPAVGRGNVTDIKKRAL